MRSWTPNIIRSRVLEIVKDVGTKMTPEEIHSRMPSCDRQKLWSQLSYMASKGAVIKIKSEGEICRYQWNQSADANRWISQIWRYPTPLFTEPRKIR